MLQPGLTRAVLMAHGYRCRYCNGVADTADHIVPRILGGGDDPRNLTACCRSCNGWKGGRRLADQRYEKELLIEAFILVPDVVRGQEQFKRGQSDASHRPALCGKTDVVSFLGGPVITLADVFRMGGPRGNMA